MGSRQPDHMVELEHKRAGHQERHETVKHQRFHKKKKKKKKNPNKKVGYGKAGPETEGKHRTSTASLCTTMHLCSQVVDLPEPVTLDFLDAEVEDSNKREVQTKNSNRTKNISSVKFGFLLSKFTGIT